MKKILKTVSIIVTMLFIFSAVSCSTDKNDGSTDNSREQESNPSEIIMPEPKPTDITVDLTKTEYEVGDTVDKSAMTVKIVYVNNRLIQPLYSEETDDYTVLYKTNTDSFAEGDDYFTVICGELSKKVSVTVESDKMLTISSGIYDSAISGYLGANTVSSQIHYLTNNAGKSYDKQKIMVSWKEIKNAATYVFHLALKDDFTDDIVVESNTGDAVFGCLIPNTDYYAYAQAFDASGNIIETSDTCTIKAETGLTLRQVSIDGLYNVRDLGGWTAQGGNTVNYGMLYRGGNLVGITEEGKTTFAEELGIKTEIDLRDDGTQQAVINGVSYQKCGMWQYGMLIPGFKSEPAIDNDSILRGYSAASTVSIKNVFSILADESNYPIYFHCNAGADRTGSLAFIINGLLGVDYSDLIKDFELTTFSISGARYRSKVSNDSFTDDGIMENTTNNYVGFGEFYSLMTTNYGAEGKPLSYAIANYLVSVCGISEETITAVRNILLSGQADFDGEDFYPLKVNGEEIVSKDGNVAISSEEFNGVVCYKAVASAQDNLLLDVSKINAGTKLTFKMYVPSGSAKLSGFGEMAIRSKNPDVYINFSSDNIDDCRRIDLDEWVEYEVDISDYNETTRFGFTIPAGNTYYFADVTII